eukprot:285720-Prymnesium_polylepis.1
MRYAGGTLARDDTDTPWRAAQWVPVAGPMAPRCKPLVRSCGAATGAVMAAQAEAGVCSPFHDYYEL